MFFHPLLRHCCNHRELHSFAGADVPKIGDDFILLFFFSLSPSLSLLSQILTHAVIYRNGDIFKKRAHPSASQLDRYHLLIGLLGKAHQLPWAVREESAVTDKQGYRG